MYWGELEFVGELCHHVIHLNHFFLYMDTFSLNLQLYNDNKIIIKEITLKMTQKYVLFSFFDKGHLKYWLKKF